MEPLQEPDPPRILVAMRYVDGGYCDEGDACQVWLRDLRRKEPGDFYRQMASLEKGHSAVMAAFYGKVKLPEAEKKHERGPSEQAVRELIDRLLVEMGS